MIVGLSRIVLLELSTKSDKLPTDDSMLLKKDYREYIESTEDRVKNVKQFLNTIRRGIVYEVWLN